MEQEKKIRILLWDIDATLLSFEKAEAYAIRKCFEIFGLGECTDEMLHDYSRINKGYWELLEDGKIRKDELLVRRFRDFFEAYGLDAETAADFNAEYQVRLGDKVFFQDEGDRLVALLKEKGYKQYAVTNGTDVAQTRKLEKSGLGELLDDVFISDRIGAEKPTHGFFQVVWETLQREIGAFDREEVMIIGDSLTSDMRGGVQEGIVTCWYDPKKAPVPEQMKLDHVIFDLWELEQILGLQ